MDLYRANLASDTIIFNGHSIAGNNIISGALPLNSNGTINGDGFTYTFYGNAGSQFLTVSCSVGSITLNDFHNGDFGINLQDFGYTQIRLPFQGADAPIATGIDNSGNIYGAFAATATHNWHVFTVDISQSVKVCPPK